MGAKKNGKQTSSKVASQASAVLRNSKASKPVKSIAASALAQARSRG